MRIGRLRLLNWLCYRGEHVIDLDAKAYAVVASYQTDHDRSNWGGKTALLEAVKFALTGQHRHDLEDDWISHGENKGEVELTLTGSGVTNDCARIFRTRQRGKRTTLYVGDGTAARDDAMAIQDEAQKRIDTMLGLSLGDFFFEQRSLARLVLMKPGDLYETISMWFRLGQLEECEDRVSQLAGAASEEQRRLEDQIRELETQRRLTLGERTREQLVEDIGKTEARLEKQKTTMRKAHDRINENAELLSIKSKREDFTQLVAEGKQLAAEIDEKKLVRLQKSRTDAEAAYIQTSNANAEAKRQLSMKQKLVQGQFDGACPVANITCPAREQINAQRTKNKKAFEETQKQADAAEEQFEQQRTAYQKIEAECQEIDRKKQRLETMRSRAQKLMNDLPEDIQEPENPSTLRDEFERQQDLVAKTTQELADLRAAVRGLELTDQRLEETKKRLEKAILEGNRGRSATIIFRTAQRKVSEDSLAEIEAAANNLLAAECGIEQRLIVQWSKETKTPARACDQCGNPFPKSVKIKVCERCGAGRGKQLENKLRFLPSRRSGAGEDLVGAAAQLAASAWIRRERGSLWTVALIDEPFGQLDRSLRRTFGAHLATMLKSAYGFDQAFVVAHSPDVLDSLPGRIQITSEGNWSSVTVVA